MLKADKVVGDTENLDVVDDVIGVDSPYKEYVDEWSKDVPEIGDDAMDQVYKNAGVHNAAADDAFEVGDADGYEYTGAVEFEAIFGNFYLATLPPQPNTPRVVTKPTQDGKFESQFLGLYPGCEGHWSTCWST